MLSYFRATVQANSSLAQADDGAFLESASVWHPNNTGHCAYFGVRQAGIQAVARCCLGDTFWLAEEERGKRNRATDGAGGGGEGDRRRPSVRPSVRRPYFLS